MRVSQRKGDIGVTQAIATFTKMGYDVALPITESAAYDLLVDVDNTIYRVQARFCSNQNKEVELRRIHSNSKGYVIKKTRENAYDWLYVLFFNGDQYLIKECLSERRSVRPRDEHKLVVTI